jgi:hypothetical protein
VNRYNEPKGDCPCCGQSRAAAARRIRELVRTKAIASVRAIFASHGIAWSLGDGVDPDSRKKGDS